MKRAEVHRCWAPAKGVWTPWVKPVLFACLGKNFTGPGTAPPVEVLEGECAPRPLPSPPQGLYAEYIQPLGSAYPDRGAGTSPALRDLAMVVDLPGAASTLLGARLAGYGFRPVPLYNSLPARGATIDMAEIMATLVDAAGLLHGLTADAPPVFLLDSRRLQTPVARLYDFDNRAFCRPTDFPSAEKLWTAGIRRCLLIQESPGRPPEDLAETLLAWQNRGLNLFLKPTNRTDFPAPLVVLRPTWLRRALSFYRRLGLYPRSDGSFGGLMDPPTSG